MRRTLLSVLLLFLASSAAAQWVRVDTNASLPQPFTPAGLTSDGTYLYVLSFEGPPIVVRLFRSADLGTSWTEMTGFPAGLGRAPAIFTVVDGTLVLAALDGSGSFVHVGTSDDAGATWNLYEPTGIGGPTTFGLAGHGNTFYMATTTGVAVSTDAGASWAMTSASPGNPVNWVFDSGSAVYANVAGGVFRSTDAGATWARIMVDGTLNLFSRMWASGTEIFMKDAITASILRSNDNGATWTSYTSFSAFGYASVVTWPGSDTWILYATAAGSAAFYTSMDLGVTATAIPNDGYPTMDDSTPCYAVPTITPEHIFAAASLCFNNNNGIYRYRYVQDTALETLELPSGLDIEAPYPNPATTSTTLRMTLVDTGAPEIRIVDVLGRVVRTESKGLMTPGEHRIDLDVSSLPAGLYLVDVRSGASHRTAALIVPGRD